MTVTRQVPIEVPPNDENRGYLAAKREKLGHMLGAGVSGPKLHHQGVRLEGEEEDT